MGGDTLPPEGFEWDGSKARLNTANHGVTFEEAATAFDDPLSIAKEDEAHSDRERRWVLTGQSVLGRGLTIAYTMRGENTRVISARVAASTEVGDYARQ